MTDVDVSGAREVLAELVEGARHDPVRRVKRLLHAVPVVDVNVDVQHSLVVPICENAQSEIKIQMRGKEWGLT